MNIVIIVGAIAAVISALYAFLYYRKLLNKENPSIEMGFAKGDQIVDEIEIKPDSETQKVFFRIRNDSEFSVKTPICSVRFPEILKHRAFTDKSDGTREFTGDYTVNSDLWGAGRGTTNINKNLPGSMWEIYGMPALFLRSKETMEFFIRYAFSPKPMTYNLEIKVDAEGTIGFSRNLKITVIPN